jgi:phage-related protein
VPETWRVSFFDARVEEEIFELPAGLLARFLRYAERIEMFGPDLGMPHTRAMGGGLFELRLKGPEGIARVFFGTLPGRRAVMLHPFVKKTDKTPRKELETARRRLRELKDAKQP